MPPKRGKAAAVAPPATPSTRAPVTRATSKRMCHRCLFHYCKEDGDGIPDCNGEWGLNGAKCTRCVARSHGCVEVTDHGLVDQINKVERLRRACDAPADGTERDEDEQAALEAAATEAAAALSTLLRRYDNNKGKHVGTVTPRKRKAGGSRASSMSFSGDEFIEEFQAMNNNLRALVEVGREIIRMGHGSVAAVDQVLAMAAADEPEEEDDDDEDGDA